MFFRIQFSTHLKPGALVEFLLILQEICHHFSEKTTPGGFVSNQKQNKFC